MRVFKTILPRFIAPFIILTMMIMPIQQVQANRLVDADKLIISFISNLKTDILDKNLDVEERNELFAMLIDTYFDVDGIVRFTAGRYWRTATKEQRQSYRNLFGIILILQANALFDQIMELEFIPIKSTMRGDKIILVNGIIHDISGQFPDIEVKWRVSAVPNKPLKIIDLEIENISMLKTHQDENTTLIRRNKGDFDAILKAFRAKIEDLKAIQ